MAAHFASRNGLLDVYLSYIFMKGFLSRINRENSLFSFLCRVCSRSYHLRDDRQIFCHEFLRRYICVLCRVVPHSGEVREFLQTPPKPRPSAASFPVVLGDFGCDVTCQAYRENSLTGLGTRRVFSFSKTRKSWGRGAFQSTVTRVQRSFPRG